jgi:hypothetical protein
MARGRKWDLMRRIASFLACGVLLASFIEPVPAAESGATITYCHGYGCTARSRVILSPAEMARLKALVTVGKASPAAEREALGKAQSWYERVVGATLGTGNDKPKGDFQGAYDLSQLDCIDESTNTTAFLKLIESRGWLSQHTVGKPRTRGFLLDGRYPHNTAVVVEKGSKEQWAIDSWIPANGEMPDIKPISVWVKEGRMGSGS